MTARRSGPLLVVVNGPPAAGKTTLAEHLERALRLPQFSKDGFKETVYELDDDERWLAQLADVRGEERVDTSDLEGLEYALLRRRVRARLAVQGAWQGRAAVRSLA